VPVQPDLTIARTKGDEVILPTPLFLDAAPWHHWTPTVARCLAGKLSERGVLVSALERELGDDQSALASAPAGSNQARKSTPTKSGPLPTDGATDRAGDGRWRMLPYRSERYGLLPADLDVSRVIDVQLSGVRDSSGRFAYSAERLSRLEITPDGQPLSGGGWVPAMTLPPDLAGLEHLSKKLLQLRQLAPQSAVIISTGPEWLQETLTPLLAARPDALLVRLDHLHMDGLALVSLFQNIQKAARQQDPTPLWLTLPQPLGPATSLVEEADTTDPARLADDAVKILALGASAVGIDHWLQPLYPAIAQIPPPSRYASNPLGTLDQTLEALLADSIDPLIQRFVSLLASRQPGEPADALASSDAAWAKAVGVRPIPWVAPTKQT